MEVVTNENNGSKAVPIPKELNEEVNLHHDGAGDCSGIDHECQSQPSQNDGIQDAVVEKTTPIGSSGKCGVCGETSELFCKRCCLSHYCCRDHQKQAWKDHKQRCYPVRRVRQDKEGVNGPSELIVSRDILQGELFLKEYPLLVYPHSSYPGQTVCVECCNPIYGEEGVIPCSECGLELCSEACQSDIHSHHKANECSILKKWKDQNLDIFKEKEMDKYFAIGMIRALLLRQKHPDRWAVIEKMDSFRKEREAISTHEAILKTFASWIQIDCGMDDYDEDTINHVLGVLHVNPIDMSDHFPVISSPTYKNASVLFPLSSQVGNNCIPNARYSIKGRNTGEFQLFMIANVGISRGSPVSVATEHGFTATFLRSDLRKKWFYPECSCDRCKDRTELGTYISALKCRTCGGENYCLPATPPQADSSWKCVNDNCNGEFGYEEVTRITESMSNMLYTGAGLEPSMDGVHNLLKCISKLKESIFHPNHFLILNAEMDVCKRLMILASNHDLGGKEDLMIDLSKHILSIADVLAPGFSRLRGQIMYYLQFAMVSNFIKTRQRFNGRRKLKEWEERGRKIRLEECRKYRRELQQIFEMEPKDSEEYDLLNSIKGDIA